MLMTIKEVTSELRLSRTTVNRMIKNNEIPSIIIGGSRRFSRQQFQEWIDSLTYRPVAHA